MKFDNLGKTSARESDGIFEIIFRNTLEKQGGSISKSICQLPKLVDLFLDTTKNDPDWNHPSLRSEMNQLREQFPIIGQCYYELYGDKICHC